MPQTTHDVSIEVHTVTKRFRSWERHEPAREWTALSLLDLYAPGLAPRPLTRRTEDERPVIVMSRLSGVSLGTKPLTTHQVQGVANALNALHSAVPTKELETLPRRLWTGKDAVAQLRQDVTEAVPARCSPMVQDAYALGSEWLNSSEAARFAEDQPPPVFAQADGNLANFLWDGARCTLVDFEDSGVSDRAFEIADLVEHVTAWLTGVLDTDELLRALELDEAVTQRVLQGRRVQAMLWLCMLLPGHPGHHRNPPGSVDRQAKRLLQLLT